MHIEQQRQQAIQARCLHPTGKWEPFCNEALEQTIIARFAQMVARYPERLAVQMRQERLTYRELDAAANRLAAAILAACGNGPEALALLLEQSVQAIVAMLAVWKAGKFFMALNPADPPARLAQMLQDGRAKVIITTRHQRARLPLLAQAGYQIITLDELSPELPATAHVQPGAANTLACIIYTSGSTGRPKGVVYNQRNVLYRAQQFSNLIHICAEDRLALVEYYSFSGSLRDIFATLLNGAALFLFNLAADGAEGFAQLLQQEAITIWSPVVTAFRIVNPLLHATNLPHLRVLGIAGETLHLQDLERYRQCTPPSCILTTALGSSETVGSVLRGWLDHQSELPTQAVPLGYPVAEVELLLLNELGKAVPVGAIGEIVVRSNQLAQGYWQQPAATAKVFLPDPYDLTKRLLLMGDLARQRPDGQFVHLGRKDQQVKIRGHRVELSEVEQALIALNLFKAVAVIARPNQRGEQQLFAYLVPRKSALPNSSELRHRLQQLVPEAMIPTRFIALDALPLTITGKVDRHALPVPANIRPPLATPYQAPRTPLEMQIAAVWGDVLDIDAIGVYDHFLDLGGHSLLATQIILRLQKTFLLTIPLQILFETPTIAAMAAAVATYLSDQPMVNLVQRLTEIETLSDFEAETLLGREGVPGTY